MNALDGTDMDEAKPVNIPSIEKEECKKPITEKLCIHCKEGIATRPRKLCYTCYTNLLIRALYKINPIGPTSRGYGLTITGIRPIPDTPTDAFPGSERKIAVLKNRASRGEELWHPDDLTLFNIEQFLSRMGILPPVGKDGKNK